MTLQKDSAGARIMCTKGLTLVDELNRLEISRDIQVSSFEYTLYMPGHRAASLSRSPLPHEDRHYF